MLGSPPDFLGDTATPRGFLQPLNGKRAFSTELTALSRRPPPDLQIKSFAMHKSYVLARGQFTQLFCQLVPSAFGSPERVVIAKVTTGPEGGQTQTHGSCHGWARSLCPALAGGLGPSAS